MMKLRGLVLSGLLAALIAPAASAQGAGTVEFGVFAKKNWFGDSYGLADRTGGGLRLGFFPAKFVEIAASGAYTPTRYAFSSGRVDQVNAAGELVFNVGLDPHAAMFFGGRYVYNKYFDRGNQLPGISAEGHESGPGALVGFRFGIGGHLSVRVDGNVDFMGVVGDPNFALNSAPDSTDQHWGFSAGLAWMFGNTGAVGDADHDGVKDNVDQCPDTPRGVKVVKETGCPPVNQDSINAAKAAAEAAAAAKAREDSIAAAERARADSIAAAERARADSIAAAERAAAQAARDSAAMAAGLSAAQIQALRDSLAKLTSANAKVTLPGVNFATGTATLTQSSRFILDEVAATLNDNPTINVEVSGHTDNTGGRKLNERLSQQRADAVRNYLVSKGVSGDRMTAKGYAWDRPVASNATRAGRALNRRTELDRTN
jgi:outer membrane protein OmpA-like peptidoglycan-associated protein